MVIDLFRRFLHFVAFFGPGGSTLRPWLHRLRGVKLGKRVWISHFVYIDDLHPEQISIGDNCTIGLRTSIFVHFYWGFKRHAADARVVIEKDVFIGPHCVILPNVTIGEGSVIKAGTVVSRNVPPHTFWGAPSAEPIGTATIPLTPAHTYEEFLAGVRLRHKPKGGRGSAES